MSKEILAEPVQKQVDLSKSRERIEQSPHSRRGTNGGILQLQRAIGNRRVSELIGSGQIIRDGRLLPTDAITAGGSFSMGGAAAIRRDRGPSSLLSSIVHRQDRGDNDWMKLIPLLPEESKGPKEANWDVGPAGKVDKIVEGWNEKPNFPNGLLAHEGSPELDRGKTTFRQDWDTLQAAWNNSAHLSNLYNIQAKIPDAYVSEINGKPVEPPKSVQAPKLENDMPAGKGGFSVGSLFNTSNELDLKTPFDPKSLKPTDRKIYDDKKSAAIDARGNRLKAEITINDKMINVSKSWSKLRQAKIKEKQAEATKEQKDVAVEKTVTLGEKEKVETIIKGAEGIIAAGEKKDVTGAAMSLLGTLTTLYFKDKLDQLDVKTGLLDAEIAELQTSYEMETVKQSEADIQLAMNDVKKALPDLDTAITKQEAAYNDFSASVGDFAKKLGLSADDIKTVQTAAAALPKIDETIGQIVQIEAACNIPGYTPDSGVGAGLISNLETFKTHLANLKAFKASLMQLKETWDARRRAAQGGVGIPPSVATP